MAHEHPNSGCASLVAGDQVLNIIIAQSIPQSPRPGRYIIGHHCCRFSVFPQRVLPAPLERLGQFAAHPLGGMRVQTAHVRHFVPRRCSARISGIPSSAIQVLWLCLGPCGVSPRLTGSQQTSGPSSLRTPCLLALRKVAPAEPGPAQPYHDRCQFPAAAVRPCPCIPAAIPPRARCVASWPTWA